MLRTSLRLFVAALALPLATACSAPASSSGEPPASEDEMISGNCEAGTTLAEANAALAEAARLAQIRIDARKGKASICGEEAYARRVVALASEASLCKSVRLQIAEGGSAKDKKPGWVVREGLAGTLGVAEVLGSLYSGNAGTIAKELAGAHSKGAPVRLYGPAPGVFGNEEIFEFAPAASGKAISKDVTIKTLSFDDAGNVTYVDTKATYSVSEGESGIVLSITDGKSEERRFILHGTSFVPEEMMGEGGEFEGGFEETMESFSIYPSECEA